MEDLTLFLTIYTLMWACVTVAAYAKGRMDGEKDSLDKAQVSLLSGVIRKP